MRVTVRVTPIWCLKRMESHDGLRLLNLQLYSIYVETWEWGWQWATAKRIRYLVFTWWSGNY